MRRTEVKQERLLAWPAKGAANEMSSLRSPRRSVNEAQFENMATDLLTTERCGPRKVGRVAQERA